MTLTYGSKRDKSLTTNGWAAKEGQSVQETEHLMDVELFLEGQARWEVDSPHHLIILHEMFQHASEQGQKEAECMIHQGCQHGLLKLDPKVDISAVQLVGPQTSREESKPYTMRYTNSGGYQGPPREPELVAEVVSSLEDHLGWKGGEMPQTTGEPNATDVQPPRSRIPRRGRDASTERSLAEVREAHWKALAMVGTLEEEIEWLSCPLTRSQLEAWAHSWSWDHCRWRSRGWKRRHHQVQPEDCCAPYFEYLPSWRG